MAQLEDLDRPGSRRQAVWLSPRNVHHVALIHPHNHFLTRNFDGLGGVLITRDATTANDASRRLAYEPVRKVVGELVCAGSGKPEFTSSAVVAQWRTPHGAVVRESLQPDCIAASSKIAEWAADGIPGHGHTVATLDALERRRLLLSGA